MTCEIFFVFRFQISNLIRKSSMKNPVTSTYPAGFIQVYSCLLVLDFSALNPLLYLLHKAQKLIGMGISWMKALYVCVKLTKNLNSENKSFSLMIITLVFSSQGH